MFSHTERKNINQWKLFNSVTANIILDQYLNSKIPYGYLVGWKHSDYRKSLSFKS